MIKGQLVDVYQDPITRKKLEALNARVTKILRVEDWTDDKGRTIVRCNVRFSGERGVYERDVSDF